MARSIQYQVDVRYDCNFLLFIQPDIWRPYTDTTYSKRDFNPLLLVMPVLPPLLFVHLMRKWT